MTTKTLFHDATKILLTRNKPRKKNAPNANCILGALVPATFVKRMSLFTSCLELQRCYLNQKAQRRKVTWTLPISPLCTVIQSQFGVSFTFIKTLVFFYEMKMVIATLTHNNCTAALNYKDLRGIDTTPVTQSQKLDMFHMPVVTQTHLPLLLKF